MSIRRLSEVRDEDGNLTHQMCCICFNFRAIKNLARDENGDLTDVCGRRRELPPPGRTDGPPRRRAVHRQHQVERYILVYRAARPGGTISHDPTHMVPTPEPYI